MKSFLEKHGRNLNADELRNYAHIIGCAPVVSDCLSVLEKERMEREDDLEAEKVEQEEKEKEELQERFDILEENLFAILKTASYEEIEGRIEAELSRFRLLMQIGRD